LFILVFAIYLTGCGGTGKDARPSAKPAATETPRPSPVASPEQSASENPPVTAEPEDSSKPEGKGDLQVIFLNVGRADSALVTFSGRHYLVDTGLTESLPSLVGALRGMGVETLDGIFLSHTHTDHTGGLTGLLQLFDVKAVYAAEITENKKNGTNVVDEKAAEAGKTVQRLKRGDEIVIDTAHPDVKFSVAGPIEYNADDDNDNSLVLYLASGDFSCLFTGDMQFAEEKSLLEAGALHPCTVLKVGNHGNPDATSPEFVSAVSPGIAVISTDSTVDTDTPSPDVLKELSKVQAKVYVTQDAKTGVRVDVRDGKASAELYTAKALLTAKDIRIESIDRESELLTLKNTGNAEADLSQWWILSERGGELFVLPAGTRIVPGGVLTIASGKNPPEADLTWPEKNVWHDKKSDTAILYDHAGNEAGRKELP
jgi:competence protein ComEC